MYHEHGILCSMTTLHAIVYGILQGLTEFLPISSSGHLVLAHAFFDSVTIINSFTFDIALHLATAVAVMVYFHKDVRRLVFVFFRMLGRLPIDRRDAVLLKAIVIGTIPAGIAGVFFEDIVAGALRNPAYVAVVLLVGSAYLAFAERRARNVYGNTITVWRGLMIGVAQALAIVPGFSRSGATIGAGMMLGLSRLEAARFSFLLALPIILGSGLVQFTKVIQGSVSLDWNIFLWGGVSAFISGILVIRFLLGFVRTHSLYPFIWYRVALAVVVLAVVYIGV